MSRRLTVLLSGCVFLLLFLEGASRWVFGHLRSNRSLREEAQTALTIASPPGGPGSVLVVGNSLVLHGIDVNALNRALGVAYVAHREAIVGSGYDDWLYGVRSLLDRGSRPTLIVLGISPAQLVTDRPPVGAVTRLVWTTHNLTQYAIDNRVGLTVGSNLLLEHFSTFFALRDQIRQDSRKLIVPRYEDMSRDFFNRTAIAPDSAADVPIGTSRLALLDSACSLAGVRFAYLLIPTGAPDDAKLEAMLIEAGARTHVPVLIPEPNRTLVASDQEDGYHLNPKGAAAFSDRAGAALRRLLDARGTGRVAGGS